MNTLKVLFTGCTFSKEKLNELTEKELQELFVLVYNHDIGYEFVDNNLDHGILGGEILKESNYKY